MRRSLATVVSDVVKALKELEGSVVTVSDLSRRVGASWESVLKALRILEEAQSLWESGIAVDVFREGRTYRVTIRRRFKGLPLNEVVRKVRELYFPEPDEMDVLLVEMLRRGATSESRALGLRGPMIKRALELGYVEEVNGKYYLTELGVSAAKVALEMYPELERMEEAAY